MSDRERAKEWIDEISPQEVDRFLYFLNLCLTKKGLFEERCELKKEIKRLNNIINGIEKFLIDVKHFDYVDKLNELKESK